MNNNNTISVFVSICLSVYWSVYVSVCLSVRVYLPSFLFVLFLSTFYYLYNSIFLCVLGERRLAFEISNEPKPEETVRTIINRCVMDVEEESGRD